MNTAGDLVTFVKTEQRITDTSQDSQILAYANKNLVRRTRGRGYPQLLVQGTTLVTTAGTCNYGVASNFFKLVPNSVRYGVQNQGVAQVLPDVDMSAAEAWLASGTGTDPQVCIIVAAGTNAPGKQLSLIPPFTNTGQTVTYDYYAQASTFASTASTAQVPEILEVLAYDTCADMAVYLKRFDEAADYRAQAKALYIEANRSLIA